MTSIYTPMAEYSRWGALNKKLAVIPTKKSRLTFFSFIGHGHEYACHGGDSSSQAVTEVVTLVVKLSGMF